MAPSRDSQQEQWRCIAQGVLDAAGPGACGYDLPRDVKGRFIRMRGITVAGGQGEWSDAIAV